MSYSWIRDVLLRDPNWRGGIDLNQDGKIGPEEQVQNYNQNGLVGDSGDWELFAANNAEALQKQIAFFGWSAPFKKDNPIHELLSIESELATPQEVKETYAFVESVLKLVRLHLNDGRQRSNQEKLKLVYDVMKELGVRFFDQKNPLLTANVREKTLDCDTSSFVVKAIAHEMGWPVYLVRVPEHAFVRWEEMGGERFNMDEGEVLKDAYYVMWLGLSQASIDSGVYLSSQSPQELRSQFFINRGISKANLGYNEEAIQDYDIAIGLDPKFANVYNNRGVSKANLGHDEEAIQDYEASLRIDPSCSVAKYNLAMLKENLGR